MKFSVDTERVAQTGTKMEELVENVDNARNTVYNSMESLSAMWQGAAHDTFAAACRDDNARLEELLGEIRKLYTDIGAAGREYETCEESVKQTINSIRI